MPLFTAKAIYTGDQLLSPGIIDCQHGRIAAIESRMIPHACGGVRGGSSNPLPDEAIVDFGDALIVPAFINAHCHLEYSFLRGKLHPAGSFAEWLEQIVPLRRAATDEEVAQAAREAIDELLRQGTAAVFDIATRDTTLPALNKSPLRAWAFLETLRLDPAQAEDAFVDLVQRLQRQRVFEHLHLGISPHTPYTVSLALGRAVGALLRREPLPVAIHLAETTEERQMLEQGGGPLVELFRCWGVLPENWRAPGIGPVQWADEAGLLGPRTLVIHGNDLSEAEIECLARRGATVVFCPKSHAWFGRPAHPLPRLLRAGINVCLGTDSLASNDSLSMLEELREAHRQFPALAAEVLFAMAGANAARYLNTGQPSSAGLCPGAHCDLAVLGGFDFSVDQAEATLLAALENPASCVAGCILGGERVA